MPDDLRQLIDELRTSAKEHFANPTESHYSPRSTRYRKAACAVAFRLADAYDAATAETQRVAGLYRELSAEIQTLMAKIALMESRELEELHRLRKMVSRDCVTPCSCCGTMLSWQFAGDGTNCLEVATGLDHKCKFDIQSAPPGTYRHLERQIAERDAEIARLREVLTPFARTANGVPDNWQGWCGLTFVVSSYPSKQTGNRYIYVQSIGGDNIDIDIPTIAEWRAAADALKGASRDE